MVTNIHHRLSLSGSESNRSSNEVVVVRSYLVASFYVARGSTARSPIVFIPVEAISPP